MLSLSALRKAGFKKSAKWSLVDKSLQVIGFLPPEPGVYIFAVGSTILYAGSSEPSLQARIRRYAGAMRRGERSRAVHTGIYTELNAGRDVDIYTYTHIKRVQYWEGLPLDFVLGLEAGLIEELQPAWNTRGDKGRKKRAMLAVPIKS